MNNYHTPVLLHEVTEYLRIIKGKKYIDATIGGGGHTEEILKKGGIVLGIDVDDDAIQFVEKNFKFQISNLKLTLVRGNFRDIDTIARLNGFEKVAGILFDLGVSSHQLDTAQRGFSFQTDAPLDMRMDKNLGVLASDLLQILTKGELYEIFSSFGDERNAWVISESIVRTRKIKPIQTTMQLVDIIEKSLGKRREEKIHPATRVFQSLRIVVNSELENIKTVLPKAVDLLGKKGRLVMISFQSLDDKIVKEYFKTLSDAGKVLLLTKKPVVPSIQEIAINARSRSAKLRAIERL